MKDASVKADSSKTRAQRRNILTKSPDFLSALRELLELRNPQKPYSFRQLASKLGLKSTGYISEVLQGKKKLGRQHCEALAKVLKLNVLEAEYLTLLWDRSYPSADLNTRSVEQQLLEIRRVFELNATDPLANGPKDVHFALLVYTAFSLFGGLAKPQNIKRLFSKEQSLAIDQAIHDLRVMGLLISQDGQLKAEDQSAFYSSSQDGKSHIRFFQAALEDGIRQVPTAYDSIQDSYFLSTFVAVNKRAYEEKLQSLRKEFFKDLASLEDPQNECNQVISFNIQIYPKVSALET